MKQDKEKSRKLIGRPSPAMIVAMTALIVALTGSAYAALRVPRNSVGTRQLKAKSVTNGKLANGAVTGAKIAEGTITGANVNLNALGIVPQAANAANAANASTVGGHAASCPANTTLIRGLCFDTHSNSEAPDLETAAERCAAKGGYLPTPMELYSTKGVLNLGTGVGAAQHQYTDDVYSEVGGGNYSTVVIDGVGSPVEQETDQPSAYYCVYPLVR